MQLIPGCISRYFSINHTRPDTDHTAKGSPLTRQGPGHGFHFTVLLGQWVVIPFNKRDGPSIDGAQCDVLSILLVLRHQQTTGVTNSKQPASGLILPTTINYSINNLVVVVVEDFRT